MLSVSFVMLSGSETSLFKEGDSSLRSTEISFWLKSFKNRVGSKTAFENTLFAAAAGAAI